jgi:hypothetical protein
LLLVGWLVWCVKQVTTINLADILLIINQAVVLQVEVQVQVEAMMSD